MALIKRQAAFVAALLTLAAASAPAAVAAPAASTSTLIAQGRQSSYSWTVNAGSGEASASSARPCLTVAITHRHGPFSYDRSRFRDCAPGGLGRTSSPLLAGGTHLAGMGEPAMSVFALATSTAVSQVRVTVAGAGPTAIPVHRKAGPDARPLGIAVIALHGAACIEQLATVSSSGRTLWQGAPTGFPAGNGCAAQ